MKRKALAILGICLIAVLALMPAIASCTTETTTAPTTAAPAPTTSAPTVVSPTVKPTAQPTAQPTAKPTAQPTKTLKIGIIANLGNAMGIDLLHGAEIMTDVLNSKGGINVGGEIYQIQIIAYDSQNVQASAVSAANRLVYQDNVKFILHDPQLVESYLPITEANGVILNGGTASQSTVANGLKYSMATHGTNFAFPIALAWYVKNNPDKIERYVFAAPDDQNGHFSIDMFMGPILTNLGVKWQVVYYPAGTTDLSAAATKVLSLNPTTVDCSGGGDLQDAQAVKAVYQAGYRGQFFTGGGSAAATLTQFIPEEAMTGFMCTSRAHEFDPPLTQNAKDLVAGYIAKYGKWDFPSIAIDEYLGLLAAAQQGGSLNVDKIISVVYNGMKFEALNGPMWMVGRPNLPNYDRKTRDSVGTVIIKRFEGKTAKVYDTVPPDEGLALYQQVYPSFQP